MADAEIYAIILLARCHAAFRHIAIDYRIRAGEEGGSAGSSRSEQSSAGRQEGGGRQVQAGAGGRCRGRWRPTSHLIDTASC